MRLGEWSPAGLAARIRSLWRGLRHGDAVEAEMQEEFRHHLELRTADLSRRGLTPEQAARQARAEFGHIASHISDARISRGLALFDQLRFSALDVRLGVRMLVKYPALSLVSVVGMAVAIAIGAAAYIVIGALLNPALPLPRGERVVVLRNAIITDPGRHQATLRDFAAWRDELKSVQDLAAFTTVRRNLMVPGAEVDLIRVVRMTASGFRLARTAPVLGRPLLEEDERSDARVVVIAFAEWQRRFAADPGIIGRRVRLGGQEYAVVGVMPEGFAFPVNDRYWIPFVVGAAERERADAIAVTIAGSLPDGSTIDGAQAELTLIGTRMASAYPETHERLRPRVLPYTRAFFDVDSPELIWTLNSFRLFIALLLVVIAVNVAILVFARTATRAGEIAVRTALGASRTRVVMQLFAEALVVSGTAAAVGLAIAGLLLARLQAMGQQVEAERRFGVMPFWLDVGLTPAVIAYALALAIVGAAIVGVVPGLKATGKRVQTSLQRLSGHGARMQLGRVWTALIVAQVAIAVAVLPFAVHDAAEMVDLAVENPGYPAEEFLDASLTLEPADVFDSSAANKRAVDQRFRARAAELVRRLESDPAVAGLTIRLPRSDERIELEAVVSPNADERPIDVGTERVHRVEAGFFALYGMPIVAGRAFADADLRAGATAVIINQVFAERALGSGAVLGRRMRFVRGSDTSSVRETGPWLEIVGVVRDLEGSRQHPENQIYLPADAAQLTSPIHIAIRTRVSPATSFAPRLRELAAAVDPMLQLHDLIGAAERHRQWRQVPRYLAIGTTVVTLSVLLLSAAGIYAMMSFTVARRRREIGIRSALGADARRVLTSIFARASAQLGTGILFGLIGTVAIDKLAGRGPVHDGNAVVLLVVAAVMTTVGLLAATGPARRGLAVQPTEALRDE